MKLIIATKNQGKMREIRQLLSDLPFEVLSMEDAGVTLDVVEDADTFPGNAMKKAEQIMAITGELTLADDSGLMVEALDGAPGVYSARYAGEGATDGANNRKLLAAMEGQTNRAAKFVAAIALASPQGRREVTIGELHGEIAHEMRGEGGFGYDVLFELPSYGKTSAQLPPDEKNRISHRGKALAQMKEILKTL